MSRDVERKISQALIYELRYNLDKYDNVDNGMVPLRDVILKNPSLAKIRYETVFGTMSTSRNEDGYRYEYFRGAQGDVWVRASFSKSTKKRHHEAMTNPEAKRRRLGDVDWVIRDDAEMMGDNTQEWDAAADIGEGIHAPEIVEYEYVD